MKKSLLGSLFTAAVLCTSSLSHAALTNFTDYNLGGTTASWDIFYGPNYEPVFNFTTGTPSNPLDSDYDEEFTLTASVTGTATGPAGPTPPAPGNREYFYTFFATSVKFTIWGMVGEGETLDNFALQILQASGGQGGISNIQFNGAYADVSGVNGSSVQYWTWGDLGLQAGESFKISFEMNTEHSNLDAVQIQMDAQAIPEPSTSLLLGIGTAFALWNTRRRAGMAKA